MARSPETQEFNEIDVRDLGQSGFSAYEVPKRFELGYEESDIRKIGRKATSEHIDVEDE